MQKSKDKSHYFGRTIVLTTKHRKAEALALPFKAGLGALLRQEEIDTDKLGTFTGEIERSGTPFETALKKARLGMKKTGVSLGLASEGSFGPHPLIPFIAVCQELLVLVDDDLGIEICESIYTEETNYRHIETRSIDDCKEFLALSKFPSHGLIVRPNQFQESSIGRFYRAVTAKSAKEQIYKGLREREDLAVAISCCRELSGDGLARIETDMRAHMNPTRMRVLRRLGIKLSKRLQRKCASCGCPGFGLTGGEGSLLCEECNYPSETPALEVYSCLKCNHRMLVPRRDGITHIEAMYCQRCNP